MVKWNISSNHLVGIVMHWGILLCLSLFAGAFCDAGTDSNDVQTAKPAYHFHAEPAAYKAMRMDWWRQGRLGLFLHWGLYAVPAGKWNDHNDLSEWIMSQANIPLSEYEAMAERFNPIRFDAAVWVAAAKMAGMKYIVITAKHHDGFCMFDTALTDYDIIDRTPFKRDALKELSEECRRQGIKFCAYYSILDWHHPDYLPRRPVDPRPTENAQFGRYVEYIKGQLKEIITQYDPAVLWFDGEWEKTWTETLGRELYNYLRSLKPDLIINDRLGKSPQAMAGTYDPNTAIGDFRTLEQEIPSQSLGYDWETCMTISGPWGYNPADVSDTSVEELIEKLIDTASKGGNLLLNVGPTAEGVFPSQAVERLAGIGDWMQVHSQSIYGTTASRFNNLPFGPSTTKDNRIYLHIIHWPQDGKLILPGLLGNPVSATFLQNPDIPVGITLNPMDITLAIPDTPLKVMPAVIELEFNDVPEILYGPEIYPKANEFTEPIDISFSEFTTDGSYRIYYTLDGSDPNTSSLYYEEPFTLRSSATVSCQKIDANGNPLSPVSRKSFKKLPQQKGKN